MTPDISSLSHIYLTIIDIVTAKMVFGDRIESNQVLLIGLEMDISTLKVGKRAKGCYIYGSDSAFPTVASFEKEFMVTNDGKISFRILNSIITLTKSDGDQIEYVLEIGSMKTYGSFNKEDTDVA